MASLWWVQDRSTSDLMIRFYKGMWEDSLAPSAALRKAQLALLENPATVDPFHWAAFVHQGGWDPIGARSSARQKILGAESTEPSDVLTGKERASSQELSAAPAASEAGV